MPARKGSRLIRGDDFRRFWSKTKRVGTCVLWTGAVTQHFGHGKFMTGPAGKQTTHKAHRWIYEKTIGPIKQPVLRHKCDNAACVNVKHLVPGTQLDNVHDAIRRGRRPGVGSTKVRTMRRLARDGVTATALACRFKISVSTAWNIINRKTWAHV